MIVIGLHQLKIAGAIGTGGTSVVYHATSTDPALPIDLAFKTPRRDPDPNTAERLLAGIRKAVHLRDVLPSADIAELDSLTTWPLAMVRGDDGRDVGCLMRLTGRDYYIEARPPGGQPLTRLFELQLLSASAEHIRAMGINRSAADDGLLRLALLARLAYIIEVIHRPRGNLSLVYGDLNLRKVVLATQPPRVCLMGCDSVADVSDPSRLQLNAPAFVPPELLGRQQRLQDQLTDVYKLGLCVIRGLSCGDGAAHATDPTSPLIPPGMLDRKGIDVLSRAVGADRGRRPSAEEIKDYLVGRIFELAEDPLVRLSS